MKIQIGQISIECEAAEIPLALATLEKLAQFAPVAIASAQMPVQGGKTTSEVWTADQVEQAKQAIEKGYGFESAYKAITGLAHLRRTSEERSSGLTTDQAAEKRLVAIATGSAMESVGDQVPQVDRSTLDPDDE